MSNIIFVYPYSFYFPMIRLIITGSLIDILAKTNVRVETCHIMLYNILI